MPESERERSAGGVATAAPSRGAGRKAETQGRIVEAAVALFATQGFERTSVAAIADRAQVSRAAVFWHFGDKASLFQEAIRRMLVPFVEEFRASLAHLPPRERLFELFNVYERFTGANAETIESFVRWALESKTLRDSLRKPLFALHDELTKDFRETLEELLPDAHAAAEIAAAMMSMLDGNLLLDLLESNERNLRLRRAGVRRFAELVIAERA